MAPTRSRRSPRALFAAAAASVASADSLVQVVDMYRAMAKPPGGKEDDPVSNNNLADAVGVLRYVHQEVIVEHDAGDPERTHRKYGINSFGHYRMKVRNPDSILEDPNKMAMPGFGRFGAFDFGVATSLDLLEGIVADGDYVGISKEDSPQINFTHPWYWFSVNGYCPNLPWTCVPPYPDCDKPAPPTRPGQCDPDGCAGKFDTDARACPSDPEFVDPSDVETLRSCCLRYDGNPDQVIQGGLCNSSVPEPTGQFGCTYKYEALTNKDFINLDELNGITSMPCGQEGDRKCKDWHDFRRNCHDPEKKFRRRFKCQDCSGGDQWEVAIENTGFCVEYDLHPYCQDTPDLCKDPRCMALSPEEKEIGLPFWKGKCEVQSNQRRAEALVAYFLKDAVKDKHLLVDKAAADASAQCASKDYRHPNQCTPNSNGGPYCTRLFGGVCSTCYIPGTDPAFPAEVAPTCPYTVLQEKGNTPPAATKCKTDDPLDLCCLYRINGEECDDSYGTNARTAEFSARGFLVVASLQDNNEMQAFASRYVESLGGAVKNKAGFGQDVYWTWHYQPATNPEQAWTHFLDNVNKSSSVDWNPGSGGAKGGSLAWIFVVLALVVVGLVGFGVYKVRASRQAQAREQLLESDQVQPSSA